MNMLNNSHSKKTLILIASPPRSGSTMLGLMLGNGIRNFFLGEPSAVYRPWRDRHFFWKCACGEDPCPVVNKITAFNKKEMHQHIFTELDVDFVIDSSKNLNWIIDVNRWAKKQEIRIINLLIYKSPVSLSWSFFKRGHDEHHWQSQYLYYQKFFDTGLPFNSVSYHELIKNPDDVLQKLCSAIGMPFFSKKKNFWEKDHHYFFGNFGVKKTLQAGKSRIQKTESYSEAFNKKIPVIKEVAAKDVNIQALIAALERKDISKKKISWKQQDYKIRYPFWYYSHMLIRGYKRYFPEKTMS